MGPPLAIPCILFAGCPSSFIKRNHIRPRNCDAHAGPAPIQARRVGPRSGAFCLFKHSMLLSKNPPFGAFGLHVLEIAA